jgi:propanol-preferring alcohol dehydrogenase
MKAMVLQRLCALDQNQAPLILMDIPDPVPLANEILVKVSTCGVCHTELDEIEGRTPPPELPIVLGHQAVGRVEAIGNGSGTFKIGDRVGIAWINSACGNCEFCRAGNENLCSDFVATGRDVNGGYAQYMTVPEAYAHRIPDALKDTEAAPMLCAGAIGYRSLRLAGLRDGQNLGLTGFGGSGHLVLKMVKYSYPEAKVFVFARSEYERAFALELGASWVGEVTRNAPEKLHCIIDTTPAWQPVVEALNNLAPGGRLVINAIRKEDRDKEYLTRLDYPEHLWMEKEIKSVANVTRKDVGEFLSLAAEMGIRPEIQEYPLAEANQALVDLKTKGVRGAKVLRMV